MTVSNILATAAFAIDATALAFKDASKGADMAATPFARSALASLLGSAEYADLSVAPLLSMGMLEARLIALFGSPNSDKTGKPISKVSGLRDIEGGTRFYQAWKDIVTLAENVDADAWIEMPTADSDGIPGARAIRSMLIDFVLEAEGAKSALFGRTGITAAVKLAMTDHAKAIATHNGVVEDAPADKGEANDNGVAVSLHDRIAQFMVALSTYSAADIVANEGALQSLRDAMDDAYNAAVDAVTPATVEAIAA